MFKNKLVKNVLLATVVGATLLLTACGDSNDFGEVEYGGFEPDAMFVTSDVANLTNQEAFELMIQNPTAIHILLEMVDYALLSEDFEINTANTVEFWEDLKEMIDDLDEWFLMSGFPNEAYVMRYLDIRDLRTAVARDLAEIDEETIQVLFDQWYGNSDYEFEDKYEEIRDMLIDQAAEQLSGMEVLRLRAEGDLQIFNETLASAYADFLASIDAEYQLAPATSEVDNNVIARVNGVDLTIDEFFHHLTNQIGMTVIFEHIDSITTANYELDRTEVYEQIDELREALGDDFYLALAHNGLATVEDLFDFLAGLLIDEELVRAHREPTEEQLQILFDQRTTTVGASHILVSSLDFARELIEQLEAAATDEFADLFAELAIEHSSCGSAASGGDLGTWSRGQMVVEFDLAVFDQLAVGEFTSEPVETQFGFHIIYKTFESEDFSFEEIRDELITHFINIEMQRGVASEIRMELRLSTGIAFENPILQSRFEFITDSNVAD